MSVRGVITSAAYEYGQKGIYRDACGTRYICSLLTRGGEIRPFKRSELIPEGEQRKLSL